MNLTWWMQYLHQILHLSCQVYKLLWVGWMFSTNHIFHGEVWCIIICDIVADSKQRSKLLSFLFLLSIFWGEEIIIGGDFNLFLDVKKRGLGLPEHTKKLEVIQDFSENLDLFDIWRLFNPEAKKYTWRQNQPAIHCRLDCFSAKWIIRMWCNPCRYCSWLQSGPFYDYSECSPSLQPQRQRFLEAEHVPFIRNEICPAL